MQSLLRFICDMSKDLSDPRTGSRNCMGWYAATLCEVIAAKTNIGEDFMAFLMPYLLYGTTRNVVHEYKDATFMILAQLSNRTTLGQTVLQGKLTDTRCLCGIVERSPHDVSLYSWRIGRFQSNV